MDFPGTGITHHGARYAVLDSGAQALTWTPAGRNAVLWVSPLADYDPGAAVRGGVPVVFPWFGGGTSGERTPAHGFARTATWERTAVINDLASGGRLAVQHRLDASSPGVGDSAPFTAVLDVIFTDQLTVSLTVTNTGADDFSYEEALHTYLAVSDVTAISVDGFDGCACADKVTGTDTVQSGPIRFDDEVDRIYRHTGEAVVNDRSRRLRITKQGSANTVVWNPGPVRGSAMPDVGRYWSDFVCIEAGNVRDAAISLAPGQTHVLTQHIRID